MPWQLFDNNYRDLSHPDQCEDIRDNGRLTRKQNQNLDKFEAQWRTKLDQGLKESLDNTVKNGIDPIYSRLDKQAAEGCRETADLLAGIQRGDFSVEEGFKRARGLGNRLNEARKVKQTLCESIIRWEKEADADPMDRVEEQRRRFPAMAHATTVRLTLAYLNGEEPSPFERR